MADIFLNSGETLTGSPFSNSRYFGNTGSETVGFATGVTATTVSQTTEKVVLPGASSDYLFQQSGNQLRVYIGATLVSTITLQADADGTQIQFANGTTSAKVGPGGLTLGGSLVPSGAPGAVAPGDIVPGGSTPGQTFNLTEGADQIPGLIGSKGTTDTSGNDLILAGTVNGGLFSGSTLGATDNINAGTGEDELRVIAEDTLLGGDQTFNPFLDSVERVIVQNLTSGDDIQVNMTNVIGAEEVGVFNTPSGTGGEVIFNDVRNNVLISATNYQAAPDNDVQVNFAAGAITDGEINLAVTNSDVEFEIDGGGASIDVVNLEANGAASTVDIDLLFGDQVTTGLVITGNATSLDLEGAGNDLDVLTSVDATDFTGKLNLDLADNDANVTFDGGPGNTTLVIGDGTLTITTGDGNDTIVVGSGNSTINTGGGNDTVDITAGGNDTVNLGAGNDTLIANAAATKNDSLNGGAGTDTLSLDVYSAETLTGTATFEGSITGFEAAILTGSTIVQGDNVVVDVANLDDISNITIDVDTQAGTAVQAQHEMQLNPTGSLGGRMSIEGVQIRIPANLSDDDVAQYIVDNHAAAIISAYNANHPGEVMTSVVIGDNASGHIQFNYSLLSGNVPYPTFVESGFPLSAGTSFGAATEADGSDEIQDVDTITVGSAPTATGQFTVTVEGTSVIVNAVLGQTAAQTATAVANALNANTAITNLVTVSVSGNVVTLTGKPGNPPGDVTESITGDTAIFGAGNEPVISATGVSYVAPTQETQTVLVNNDPTDSDGGFVRVSDGTNSIDIPLDANLSQDQIGVAIAAQQAAIIAAIPTIQAIGYDTLTNLLTFQYVLAEGNVPPITIANTPGNFPDPVNHTDIDSAGVDGSLDGMLLIDNIVSGGTVTLTNTNNGTITVAPSTNGVNEALNVVLATGYNEAGVGEYVFDGIETLNLTNNLSSQQDININGSDALTITVAGNGVSFDQVFANLTSFNASAVTATGATGAVNVATSTSSNATLTGGAGNDTLTSGSGDDIINGGAGNDTITGGAGADILTGGTGADDFVFNTPADSQGVTVDTINDFDVANDDLLFSTTGTLVYEGQANGYGAVLTTLVNSGGTNSQAVYDTSTNTLYVDANGDGALDNADYAVDFATAVTLSSTNFA